MSARCFTRDENDGIHVIFPVEGPMKQNCLLVNDSVQFVFDRVRGGVGLGELRDAYLERAHEEYRRDLDGWDGSDAEAKPREPQARKVLFDLYRTLLSLQDHAICDYSHDELRSLLPQGKEIPGSSQLMPVVAIPKTARFLTRALSRAGEVRILYALPSPDKLDPQHFAAERITRRHFGQEEVYFIQLDKKGEVEACTVVGGFAVQPYSLVSSFIAAVGHSEDDFRQRVGAHFSRVCGLLSIVTLSAMIRLPVLTGNDADGYTDASFLELIGELGFRKSLDLPEERGENGGVITYDKTLF